MARKLIHPLADNQADAVNPRDSVWLSASAGTGKTQVLSARVLRLLLQPDTDPSQILCLTFTKAGAAEMATRVNEVLASWVRMKPDALAKDLQDIGAPVDPNTQDRARTRFASVLDCPGGGLRIDTIHAFSQWLLAAFPEEAGLTPGTQPMEERDRDLLAHEVLAAMLVEAEHEDDTALLDALAMLSVRMGPDGVRVWLMRCAEAREMWFGTGAWQRDDIPARTKQVLGLSADASMADAETMCGDERFPVAALQAFVAAMRGWGAKSGIAHAEHVAKWLAASPDKRFETIEVLLDTILKKDGTPRSFKRPAEDNPALLEWQMEVENAFAEITQLAALLELSGWLSEALAIGRAFAVRWDEAKTREGLIDFDDQIRRAAALLNKSDLSDWIRYKLDRRFDHILIDEAQDTNQSQWDIIRALTEDFFAGEGQRADKLRTIFVVGDYKQAIFRFQGTSPQNFRIARDYYESIIGDAAANVSRLRDGGTELRPLRDLPLGRSYRTSQPILDFVDATIAEIGPEQFGLDAERLPELHQGDERPGQVVLWQPILARPDDNSEPADEDFEATSEPEERMAEKIAAQVQQWIGSYPLYKGTERLAQAGDILVLVRKRKELAGLIVRKLYAAGVPVAGVDRMRLGAPLAVQDLMAALRFAAQPLDDLSLACLLVSPLVGWSQEQLLEHGYRGEKIRLWNHIRKSETPEVAETAEHLKDLLSLADYETPQALLHWLLVGPWRGRAKLVGRLGREAADPIDELLNAALNYTSAHTPSLAGFIQWFDAGDGELKRDAGASDGLVRVMTVHGAKGLQAPIVILADATGDPDASPTRGLTLKENLPGGKGRTVPLPELRSHERVGPIADAETLAKREEREEHWRLLYVAMTRAEEALFVGGALGKRDQEPKPDSWFARLAPLVDALPVDDAIWGWRLEHGEAPDAFSAEGAAREEGKSQAAIPEWVRRPIGPEPRPPRPLAPSSAGEDVGAKPPLPPEVAADAARRGVLIHALLERLPEVAAEEREERGRAWLMRHGEDLTADECAEMLQSALAVLDDPRFAPLFSDRALAEVPLAATVGGQVIAGNADRLLVEDNRVTVVDFKTVRRPPASLEEIPRSVLAQMGAYAAALDAIYSGCEIRVAVLYTHTPQLFEIPPEMLTTHKPVVSMGEESFAIPRIE